MSIQEYHPRAEIWNRIKVSKSDVVVDGKMIYESERLLQLDKVEGVVYAGPT